MPIVTIRFDLAPEAVGRFGCGRGTLPGPKVHHFFFADEHPSVFNARSGSPFTPEDLQRIDETAPNGAARGDRCENMSVVDR